MSAIGRYEVAGVIGSGGFGTVYLCTDPADGTRVAAKVLDRASTADPAFAVRLASEADAMRRVCDEHCVRVREVIIEPDLAAIVTDFINGASLRALLDRYGRLTGPQAVSVLRGALHGLVAVHRAGLLHGDVKPDNVLVDEHGVSRLIDFGLAAAPPAVGVRSAGITGSPGYLSPEQIRGEPADVRSDVYACAVMLFELLCGRRPYGGADIRAVLDAHLKAPVPDPRTVDPSISPAFASLCTRGLAKDRADRPASAADFLAELEDAARRQYGAAWRTGLGLGALVGGSVVVGAEAQRAAALHTGVAGHALRGGRRGIRLGRRTAYATGAAGVAVTAVVAIVVATGSNNHPATAAPPTGRLLVGTTQATYALVDTHGAAVQRLSLPLQECSFGGEAVADTALNPDGRSLAVIRAAGLSIKPVGRPVGPPIVDSGSTACLVDAMAWSPDGGRIAYSTAQYRAIGGKLVAGELAVINADGSGQHVIIPRTNEIHSIAWSPDGTRIGFVNSSGLHVVQALSGATPQRILPRDPHSFLRPVTVSWAPGTDLLVAELSGDGPAPGYGVWQVAPDGSGLRSVLPNATSPSRAPDGRYFAAVLRDRVVLADADGHVVRTFGPRNASTVQWVKSS